MARRPRVEAAAGSPAPRPAVRTPRQRAGDAAEDAACAHLVAAGLAVLARNVRYRDGELDIVLRDADTVVFAEVRLRRSAAYGGAAASVDRLKQRRILRCAQRWLLAHHGERWPACRFDVLCLDATGRIEWLRAAFSA